MGVLPYPLGATPPKKSLHEMASWEKDHWEKVGSVIVVGDTPWGGISQDSVARDVVVGGTPPGGISQDSAIANALREMHC